MLSAYMKTLLCLTFLIITSSLYAVEQGQLPAISKLINESNKISKDFSNLDDHIEGAPAFSKIKPKITLIAKRYKREFVLKLKEIETAYLSVQPRKRDRGLNYDLKYKYSAALNRVISIQEEAKHLRRYCFTKKCIRSLSTTIAKWTEMASTLNQDLKLSRFFTVTRISGLKAEITDLQYPTHRFLLESTPADSKYGKVILNNDPDTVNLEIKRIGIDNLQKYGMDKFRHFYKYGVVEKIQHSVPLASGPFNYDVFYYIPKHLQGKEDLKTLIFLHGGGISTKTKSGSENMLKQYLNDLESTADKLNYAFILPSSTGLNWGGELKYLLNSLVQTIKNDLPVDPNRIGLAGHSMGAMGITRVAHYVADQFAFFLPIAGGIDPSYLTESAQQSYFNFRYHHMQGISDHFKDFVPKCEAQQEFIQNLEQKYGQRSGFSIDFYDGDHMYGKDHLEKTIDNLFNSSYRNLYQKELRGTISSSKRYFWLEVNCIGQDTKKANVHAKIEGNDIIIDLDNRVDSLRVYLSSKTVNIEGPVRIIVNGETLFHEIPNLNREMSSSLKRDPGFIFDSYVDILL